MREGGREGGREGEREGGREGGMRCYTLIQLDISRRTRWWCLKCVIVYLARDITPFVMYYVYGQSGSSLLIECTDSMIQMCKLCKHVFVDP